MIVFIIKIAFNPVEELYLAFLILYQFLLLHYIWIMHTHKNADIVIPSKIESRYMALLI